MFTYIKLKNFKSLIDLEVNLTAKKDTPKKLILIYGENGSGKSNFTTAFSVLSESIQTMARGKALADFLEKELDNNPPEHILSIIKDIAKDTEALIENNKTINSKGNMVLEFGFKIKNKLGSYRLETNNSTIVSEKLEYALEKNKTSVIDINEKTTYINEGLTKTATYHKELLQLIQKYWGKHSLLAILFQESLDKNKKFIQNNLSQSIFDVINSFFSICTNIKTAKSEKTEIRISEEMLEKLASGEINVSKEQQLDNAERFLNEFFTHTYSDIKSVYYKKTHKENNIKYKLFIKKQIYGQLLDIPFENESTGTQKLLALLPLLVAGMEKRTVIIDELDTGIHDILVTKIIENFSESINGQVIITTHNTMLLESDIAKQLIYIFNIDSDGYKTLSPLSSIKDRTQDNHNDRKRYLKGLYGGIPEPMSVDFNDLLQILKG